MQEAQKIVGERVRDHRVRVGMTQQGLADLVGTSKSRLCEIECGKHNLSLKQLGKLADGLGISLEELFEGL